LPGSAGPLQPGGVNEVGTGLHVFWARGAWYAQGMVKKNCPPYGQMVLERSDDPLGLEAVKDYFTLLYEIDDAELDKRGCFGRN